MGFDFEAHIKEVLGSSMQRPLTAFHGARWCKIETLFWHIDKVWEAAPLEDGLAALKKRGDSRVIVEHLMCVFSALSIVHKQVSIAQPDLGMLERACDSFKKYMTVFTSENVLKPCAYRMKFYDHAVISHVVKQSSLLAAQGMSLAVVSSKFLEANNKVVEAVMRRLPGGSTKRDGRNSHLPVVQALRRCVASSFVARPEAYAAFKAEGKVH